MVCLLVCVKWSYSFKHRHDKLQSDRAKGALGIETLSDINRNSRIPEDYGWRHVTESLIIILAFVRGIHQSPIDSHPQRPIMRFFGVHISVVYLNYLLNKQSRGRRNEMPKAHVTSLKCVHPFNTRATFTGWSPTHIWPNSQIPQCTFHISHNAPFCRRNVHISIIKLCLVGHLSDAL